MVISIDGIERITYPYGKKTKFYPYTTIFMKFHPRWIKDLNKEIKIKDEIQSFFLLVKTTNYPCTLDTNTLSTFSQ